MFGYWQNQYIFKHTFLQNSIKLAKLVILSEIGSECVTLSEARMYAVYYKIDYFYSKIAYQYKNKISKFRKLIKINKIYPYWLYNYQTLLLFDVSAKRNRISKLELQKRFRRAMYSFGQLDSTWNSSNSLVAFAISKPNFFYYIKFSIILWETN